MCVTIDAYWSDQFENGRGDHAAASADDCHEKTFPLHLVRMDGEAMMMVN